MNVYEYLKVINQVFDGSELTPGKIRTTGFIDVIPTLGDLEAHGGNVIFEIDPYSMSAKRSFDTEHGLITLEKTTKLEDDISLHCGENGSPEILLSRTIDVLNSIQSRGMVDYSKSIEVLGMALDGYKEKEPLASGMQR